MKPMEFRLRVHGIPRPKGSMRAMIVWTKKDGHKKPIAVLVDSSSDKAKADRKVWEGQLDRAIQHRLWEMSETGLTIPSPIWGPQVPVQIAITFVMPRPASVKREWPSVKPDTDKLVRTVYDRLTGPIWKDDGQAVITSEKKRYARGDEPEGAIIRARRVDTSP